ncbi:conserved exported hypothetical protein [Rhodospirillaceae bacterium LM-1]|nr:conserved exported hypothetical protein [Rhodospirillaceae bacterium LM-1]
MIFRARRFSLFLLFLLAACPQLPQPFQHDAVNPLLRLDGRAGVVLILESNVPRTFATALRDSLNRQDVPVFLEGAPQDAFPLRLHLRKGTERAGLVELEMFWQLHDAEGLTIGHYDQLANVAASDWEKGAPSLMKRLADAAAPQLATLMPIEDGTRPLVSTPSKPADKQLLILEFVKGAPGDGNEALARAMRLALSANGIGLIEQAGPKAFRLQGQASVAKAGSNSESLHLEWRLLDPNGAEMALLELDGAVPAGLLEKPWGPMAGEIVASTAIELAGLIKDAGKKP